jgi:hypothetical protein
MQDKSSNTKPDTGGLKPLQSIPYSEKTETWRKQNIEYYIQSSIYKAVQSTLPSDKKTSANNMQLWFNIYNNKINEEDFNYVTNPLNTKNELYKNFPARIRSYNILRPTIDLLIGEWSKRPFKFDVLNLDGDGVINSFNDTKFETYKKNVTQRVVNTIKQSQGEQVEEIPNPKTIIEDINSNYKDIKAVKGYKAVKNLEFELKLKEKFKDQFKTWCIAGTTSSLKYVKRSDIEYEKLSPLWIDIDKSPQVKNFEDGSYATVKFRVTVADLVDMFYDSLKDKDLKNLEKNESFHKTAMYAHYTNIANNNDTNANRFNKVDLYYVTWKSRKKIGFLNYIDPFTGEEQLEQVDENYPVDKDAGETVDWVWVNEVWEGWRINDDIYLDIQPVAVQRNEMNNFSSCKLPINGRNFSDMESENVSILSLGIPYQMMYIIINYRIELTIAKSKGKILIYDKNTISDDEEEQDNVFYYAETLGYLGLDRAADDVDRTWTGYSVQDMSLFEHINQLIGIAQFYKDSWEELMGISRQRKGDVSASDGLGASQEAIFRSSVISDIIFSTFDEWVESELQGLLDLSKFAWIDGKKGYYRNDDGRAELFNIDPEDYANSEYGVFMDFTGRTASKLQLLQNQINAVAQRKEVKLSTIADMIYTDSYAELRNKLKEAEAIEAEIQKITAKNQQEAEAAADARKKDYMMYENMLQIEKQERDWDRKDNNEYIKGEIAGRTAANSVDIDMGVIEAESNKRLERLEKSSIERRKLQLQEMKLKQDDKHAKMKDETEQKKIAASLKNKVSGEK